MSATTTNWIRYGVRNGRCAAANAGLSVALLVSSGPAVAQVDVESSASRYQNRTENSADNGNDLEEPLKFNSEMESELATPGWEKPNNLDSVNDQKRQVQAVVRAQHERLDRLFQWLLGVSFFCLFSLTVAVLYFRIRTNRLKASMGAFESRYDDFLSAQSVLLNQVSSRLSEMRDDNASLSPKEEASAVGGEAERDENSDSEGECRSQSKS